MYDRITWQVHIRIKSRASTYRPKTQVIAQPIQTFKESLPLQFFDVVISLTLSRSKTLTVWSAAISSAHYILIGASRHNPNSISHIDAKLFPNGQHVDS